VCARYFFLRSRELLRLAGGKVRTEWSSAHSGVFVGIEAKSTKNESEEEFRLAKFDELPGIVSNNKMVAT
jgi:hypothetical protein